VVSAEVESQRDMSGIIARLNVDMRRLLMCLIHPRSNRAHSFKKGLKHSCIHFDMCYSIPTKLLIHTRIQRHSS
jgi:hypothetical protein